MNKTIKRCLIALGVAVISQLIVNGLGYVFLGESLEPKSTNFVGAMTGFIAYLQLKKKERLTENH